jgi:exopolysaccharide production protein ExoZ
MTSTAPEPSRPRERETLYALQIGRGVAAMMVVIGHAATGAGHFYGAGDWTRGFQVGNIGVDFFFVLSGFIIFWAHADDAPGLQTWHRYLAKRVTRIYVPYWPVGLVMLVASFALAGLSQAAEQREISIISSIFLIPQPASSWLGPTALTVAWTLIWEVMFYAIFSSWFFLRRAFPWLMALWAAAVATAMLLIPEQIGSRYWSPIGMYNLEFLTGMAVCWLVRTAPVVHRPVVRWGATAVGGGMFAVFLAAYMIGRPLLEGAPEVIYHALAFGLLVLGIGQSQLKPRRLIMRAAVFIGAASYAIYLVHDPALSVLNRIGALAAGQAPPWVIMVALALAATVAGCIYHLIIERPFTAAARKLLSPQRRELKAEPTPQSS